MQGISTFFDWVAQGEVFVLPLLIYAAIWGGINRLRGWGKYTDIFNKGVLALMLGGITFLLSANWGANLYDSLMLAFIVASGWFNAVMYGWGDYFDYESYPNYEIGWIDMLVAALHNRMKRGFTGVLGRYNGRLVNLANSAALMDGIAFGLRGAYYLALPISAGAWLHSWWFAIPGALFWQDGIVYYWCKKNFTGDYVRRAELIGGALRGLAFGVAIAATLLVG